MPNMLPVRMIGMSLRRLYVKQLLSTVAKTPFSEVRCLNTSKWTPSMAACSHHRRFSTSLTGENLINEEAAGETLVTGKESLPRITENQVTKEEEYSISPEITVTGRDAPKPFMQFDDYDWPQEIKDVWKRENYGYPTTIQSQSFPIALEGRDMVGIAQTGSGKTLSFLLPAIVKIQKNGKKNNPQGLILGPTRELIQQTYKVARMFRSISSVCLFGGASKNVQTMELRRNRPDLIIATPGRLIDMVGDRLVSLQDINYLVFDEADRMLDMGFEPQIREIITHLPRQNRQTLMWSATWPEDVQTLAEDFLTDYIRITVGSTELHANPNITQIVKVVNSEPDKKEQLLNILESLKLENGRTQKTLIFAQTKRVADALASGLRRRQFRADSTHSDKSQIMRDKILDAYRNDQLDVLVATDVASRGLHVNDIQVVINYDYPQVTEDYVHRIGRTGRVNNKGTAYTFFTADNMSEAGALIRILEESKQEVPEELREMNDMAAQMKKERTKFRTRYARSQGSDRYGDRFSQGSRSFGGGYDRQNSRYGQTSRYETDRGVYRAPRHQDRTGRPNFERSRPARPAFEDDGLPDTYGVKSRAGFGGYRQDDHDDYDDDEEYSRDQRLSRNRRNRDDDY